MCVDDYITHVMVHERLEEARATAARDHLVAELRTPWRVTIGQSLVRLGERVAGAPGPSRVQPSLG
jgi:hypothetical protein